jgi:hypothetical protein
MDRDEFRRLISKLTAQIAQQPLGDVLAERLNREHGAGSPTYETIFGACRSAIAEGWMCHREAGGIRYGRVVRPEPETHGFSVDVVDMANCAGPHHVHPNGEIDLLMPLDGAPAFDGRSAAWTVYGPASAHAPTVSGGRALILYLLPQGAIRFTGDHTS